VNRYFLRGTGPEYSYRASLKERHGALCLPEMVNTPHGLLCSSSVLLLALGG
jgi:hypothetical protein